MSKSKPNFMQDQINWNISKNDNITIHKIIKRFKTKFETDSKSAINLEMDITACHLNGNPLKLTKLLEADDLNFFHDVLGIRNCIDRTTGKLTHCFLPRYSKINIIEEEVF